jgi:hypothetical protein
MTKSKIFGVINYITKIFKNAVIRLQGAPLMQKNSLIKRVIEFHLFCHADKFKRLNIELSLRAASACPLSICKRVQPCMKFKSAAANE